jgi:Tfp pilus assembly protein PilE
MPVLHQSPWRRNAGDSTALNLLLIFVVALLVTALALPAYRNYTLREHSKLARLALEDAADRHRAWQKSHPARRAASLADFGFPSAAVYVSSDGTVSDSANISSIYRVSLSFPEAPTPESCGLSVDGEPTAFVLVAEPIQTQRIDTQCGRLCLSSSGKQGRSGNGGMAQCWSPR